MKTIERKTMLYKTGVEYGDYTINHVQGCAHGCKFPCYAMMMAKRFGKAKTYEEWCEPKLVSNALEILDKEIPKLKEKIQSVQLSFSTDPFMYGYDEVKDEYYGHGWVVDGYVQYETMSPIVGQGYILEDILFHCVWGWGGACNGYFFWAKTNSFGGSPHEFGPNDSDQDTGYVFDTNIQYMGGFRKVYPFNPNL